MARLALVCIAVLYFVGSNDVNAVTQGWFWRDILQPGDIPDNAFPGGKDNQGQTTYIGQTPHCAGDTVVPGAYVPRVKKMFYEYGNKEWTTDYNIKVLSTVEPDHFEWVKARKGGAIKKQTGWQIVPGGTEFKKFVGIGRVHVGNEIVQGKVNFQGDNYELLHYNRNDKAQTTDEFEILFYVKH